MASAKDELRDTMAYELRNAHLQYGAVTRIVDKIEVLVDEAIKEHLTRESHVHPDDVYHSHI
jgi:hypothetical protein